jgi:DNA-directed RNA polymerase specialized sigma24 family protein|tara:strand:- start:597 stop:1085 length:489 start_codon:yes stop_codon:yes gene_type:complete
VSILNELAIEDKKWLNYALKITKDVDAAKDLVQDMYLKMINYEGKEWNNGYIYLSLLNLFRDSIRKKDVIKESVDIDLIKNKFATYDNDLEEDEVEKAITKKLKTHDDYYAELALIQADGMSYRKIAYLYHVNYSTTFKKIAEIKNKLKKDEDLQELYKTLR